MEKHGFQFPLLCDERHDMLKAYGAWGPKKLAGRAYEGITRTTYLINEDGTIHKVYQRAKPDGHARQLRVVVPCPAD